MKWPQIIMIVLLAVGIGIDLQRHGEEKKGRHSAWTTFIGAAITAAILWWGGFWS